MQQYGFKGKLPREKGKGSRESLVRKYDAFDIGDVTQVKTSHAGGNRCAETFG